MCCVCVCMVGGGVGVGSSRENLELIQPLICHFAGDACHNFLQCHNWYSILPGRGPSCHRESCLHHGI